MTEQRFIYTRNSPTTFDVYLKRPRAEHVLRARREQYRIILLMPNISAQWSQTIGNGFKPA